VDSFLRLYMVPGMQHCDGGPGADVFGENGLAAVKDSQHDIYAALEQWVEKGTAPSAIIAAKMDGEGPAAKVKFTRPLCAYPQQAKYRGSGDPSDTASFACTAVK